MIELKQVYKTYVNKSGQASALRGVNLHIGYGEFVSVVGSSGSGKTTLMNIIGCLDMPTSGQYSFDRHVVESLGGRQMPKIRNEKIGFIFQNFNLIANLSAYENVELPLILRGEGVKKRRNIVSQALARVGLSNRAHFYPRELSGGQQQRVAIARALAGSPMLILADEPTGNLDGFSSQRVMDLIRDLNREGKTVVLITHDPSVAAQADRIVKMSEGRIV